MIGFIRRLTNDRRGNILVIAGASLPLLMGAAGLATDTIQWTLWKRQLQRAADSAAIAGVYTRVVTDTEEAVDAAVDKDLTINHHTGNTLKAGSPKVELLSDSGSMQHRVGVTLELQKSLPFSSMFMSAVPTIQARAIAASVPGAAEYCIVALDPSVSAVGIEISGSTNLNMGECSLIANSKHPNKAASNGTNSATGGQGSIVKAASLAAAGGVQESTSWDIDSYDPYSTPVADPFSSKPIPSSSDCQVNINASTLNGNNPVTRPTSDAGKIVCINGSFTPRSNVTLQGGTYVINGTGGLTMNNTGASLSCTGCTIILTNFTDRTKTGNIKVTGGTLAISAPTDGTYKGLALMQDPLATDTGHKTQNQINGNNGAAVQGVVYVPNQSLLYNGGGNLTSVCMQLVAKRIELSGSSKITAGSQCAAFGLSPIGGGDSARRVRLVK
jgi:Flp pilus assembly protein TadG